MKITSFAFAAVVAATFTVPALAHELGAGHAHLGDAVIAAVPAWAWIALASVVLVAGCVTALRDWSRRVKVGQNDPR